MNRKFLIFLILFSTLLNAQKIDCVDSVIKKSILEDSLTMRIDDFEKTLKTLNGTWKFVKLIDEKGNTVDKLTEKMPMSKNEFIWMDSNYSFDHTLEFNGDKLKRVMTFFEGSNAVQTQKYKLIYQPNRKAIKSITLEGDEVCTQVPSFYKIQYLDEKKLSLYHIPFDNKEKVEYILYIYEKK